MIKMQGDNDDVASSPLLLCLCFNNTPNCTIAKYTDDLYPGQTIAIDVVAVGQRFGTVTTVVTTNLAKSSDVSSYQGKITDSQTTQTVYRTCTPLQYTITSPNKKEQVDIQPIIIDELRPTFEQKLLDENPQLGTLFESLSIVLTIKDCPLAFPFDKSHHKCTCPPSLSLLGLRYNLDTF